MLKVAVRLAIASQTLMSAKRRPGQILHVTRKVYQHTLQPYQKGMHLPPSVTKDVVARISAFCFLRRHPHEAVRNEELGFRIIFRVS